MSTDIPTMRAPVTRADWPDDPAPAEFNVSGNAAKPTATTDPNVYPIPLVMAAINAGAAEIPEVEEFWQFKFRTDLATSDCVVVLWFYDYDLDVWHASTAIEVKGDDLLDPAHGNSLSMNGILGCSHVGVQVTGHAGQELYITHRWS